MGDSQTTGAGQSSSADLPAARDGRAADALSFLPTRRRETLSPAGVWTWALRGLQLLSPWGTKGLEVGALLFPLLLQPQGRKFLPAGPAGAFQSWDVGRGAARQVT